jgi:hypothetical protein
MIRPRHLRLDLLHRRQPRAQTLFDIAPVDHGT